MKLLLNPQLLSDAHGVVVYLPYYLHPALLHWGHLYAFVVEHASQSGQSVSFSLSINNGRFLETPSIVFQSFPAF